MTGSFPFSSRTLENEVIAFLNNTQYLPNQYITFFFYDQLSSRTINS